MISLIFQLFVDITEILESSQKGTKDMFILNSDEHIEKGEYNSRVLHKYFLQHLKTCPGWICIIAFYSALHYVDAYLIRKHGKTNIHHEERNRDVSILIPNIDVEYKRLYDYGNAARYDKMKNMPDDEDANNAVNEDLPRIREHLLGQL